jgi:ABC-2 type transport system ATP-binding protein
LSPEREIAVRVDGAHKAFGRRQAIAGLDLELRRGQWMGLIGPNGAGKTTSMLAIAGLVPLDRGCIEVLGTRVTGPRPDDIGWVPQEVALYTHLTARENLESFGALHGVAGRTLRERVGWALEWTGLEDRADDRVATYSGGMQRRLNIACAVLHRPRVLLLDEPTVGVDPQARLRIFAMLETLCANDVALLHSSHELDDIETTCETLCIVDGGRAIAAGAVHQLVSDLIGSRALVSLDLSGDELEIDGLERQSGGRWSAQLDDVARDLPHLLSAVREEGVEINGLDVRRPGLQEVFLELTGKDLRE